MFGNQTDQSNQPNLSSVGSRSVNNYQSNQASPLAPEKRSKKTGLIITIVSIIIILLAGGAGAFYYYNYIYLTPEKVFEKALENLTKFQSGKIDYLAEIAIKSKQNELPPTVMPLDFFASQDLNLKISAKTDFTKKQDFTQTATEILFDIPTGTKIPLVGELLYSPKINLVSLDKENIFVKIENLPMLPFFDLSRFNNQWVKINFQELQSQSGFKIQPSEGQGAGKLKEFIDKFVDLYKEYSFMKLSKLPSEKIDNLSSYHYKMDWDKEIFKNFVSGLNELSKEEGLGQDNNVNYEDQLKNLEEALAKVGVSGEVWIAKQGKILKKAKINFVADEETFSSEFKNTITLSDYNKPVEINEPTGFITIKEFMELILNASIENSKRATVAAIASSDIKQIQAALDLYFSEKGNYPFMPLGGNRLGVDALCLGPKGFTNESGQCDDFGHIPASPNSPLTDYLYFLCSENDYIIEFSVEQDVGIFKAGKNYVTPNTITSSLEIRDDCLDLDQDGLSNYFEAKYGTDKNNSDTDGDSYLDGIEAINGYNPNGSGKL